MAWDKTLPSNTTKIRNYPTVLTDNFKAIEEGDSSLQLWKGNLIQRNAIPSAPAVDPAKITNVMQLYSKQNADGNTDLYVIDDRATANVIELTENGKLGGRTTDIVQNEYYFGTDTLAYGQWANPTVIGSISSAGAVGTGSQGIASVSIVSANVKRVNFTASRFNNANYFVIATGLYSASDFTVTVLNKTTTTVDIRTSVATKGFDIVIFGGR
ncbi:MAG: hypothetical protein R3230_01195 [Nitrosopumilaceae archaeon]|nr:hypothetical protein [Nitrosopumilaceae archaeon]